MTADLINGVANVAVGLLVLNNVRVLREHRCVRGISLLSNGVFFAMAVWQCLYFAMIEQPWSFIGSAIVSIADAVWWAHVVRYRRVN